MADLPQFPDSLFEFASKLRSPFEHLRGDKQYSDAKNLKDAFYKGDDQAKAILQHSYKKWEKQPMRDGTPTPAGAPSTPEAGNPPPPPGGTADTPADDIPMPDVSAAAPGAKKQKRNFPDDRYSKDASKELQDTLEQMKAASVLRAKDFQEWSQLIELAKSLPQRERQLLQQMIANGLGNTASEETMRAAANQIRECLRADGELRQREVEARQGAARYLESEQADIEALYSNLSDADVKQFQQLADIEEGRIADASPDGDISQAERKQALTIAWQKWEAAKRAGPSH